LKATGPGIYYIPPLTAETRTDVHWSCFVLLFTDFVNCGQSRLSG